MVSEINNICKENNVGAVVVGESKDYSGKENDIMAGIKLLVKDLEKETSLPAFLHPEFMTSLEAEHIQGHNDMHDASAASLILRHFLETRK